MAEREDVEYFLQQLKEKMTVFDVVFRYRDKNLADLAEMNITPASRTIYLLQLTIENYYSGPHKDTYDTSMPDYYEFGLEIMKKTVYIKINLGKPNKPIDCISFHLAEFPIQYPFKKK